MSGDVTDLAARLMPLSEAGKPWLPGFAETLADRIAALEARVLRLEELTIPVLGTVDAEGRVTMKAPAGPGSERDG